jgi:DNA-binding transcriptional LysR family regulator
VTQGAVSRQIKELESQLGVPLFERRNRGVFLTHAGGVMNNACAQALGLLATAVHSIRSSNADAEPLVLSCEPTIAMRWLIPRLPEFKKRYPARRLHLLAAGGPVDFSRDRIDVALRRNDFHWGERVHVEVVAPELTGPVCIPSYCTFPTDLAAPLKIPCLLHTKTRPTAWTQWSALSNRLIQGASSQSFEHFYLSLQAAGTGLGMAIGSLYMVEEEIQQGRLVAPMGFIPDGSEYTLGCPIGQASDQRRLELLDWMRYEMDKSRLRGADSASMGA